MCRHAMAAAIDSTTVGKLLAAGCVGQVVISNKVQAELNSIGAVTNAIIPTTNAMPVPSRGNPAKAPIPSNTNPTTIRIGRATPLHGLS